MRDFGRIKSLFNNTLIEGIVKKDEKSRMLFKKYLKTIKESEILKTQFLVYNNIETKFEENFSTAAIFVAANLKLLEKYTPSEILRENKKLLNLLGGGKLEPASPLHESLGKVIFMTRTPNNVDEVSKHIKNVVDYVTTNKPEKLTETLDFPVGMLKNIMVKKYNEKYASLSPDDKDVVRVVIGSDFEAKKAFYNEKVKECVALIDELLVETADESKEKLSLVKVKLLGDTEIDESQYLDKISKLIDLKDNLKN